MKITIKYSYDANNVYPYHATAIYDGRHLVGASYKDFKDAEQKLLETIKKVISLGVPELKEIENMGLTIEYSYDANSFLPYIATTTYYGGYLFGISYKGFEEAGQDLLETIEKAAKIQIPEPKEIEI